MRGWRLLILLLILLGGFGYYKFFYKKLRYDLVPASAGSIIMIDVKRVTNTLAWSYLKSPSRWKFGNPFRQKSKVPSITEAVSIPDYIFIFQQAGDSSKGWHCVLPVRDAEKLHLYLLHNHFTVEKEGLYLHPEYGLQVKRSGGFALISYGRNQQAVSDSVGKILWQRKDYAPPPFLQNLLSAQSHLAMRLTPGRWIAEESLVKLNLGEEEITVAGSLSINPAVQLRQDNFARKTSEIIQLGIALPLFTGNHLPDSSFRQKFRNLANMEWDSLAANGVVSLEAGFSGTRQKTDTIVSYAYDENFEPIETKSVQRVSEAKLVLDVRGDSLSRFWRYLSNAGALQETSKGWLFTPVPVSAMYGSKRSEKEIMFAPAEAGEQPSAQADSLYCLFMVMDGQRLPAIVKSLLPQQSRDFVEKIASLQVTGTQVNNILDIRGVLRKKSGIKSWW